MSPVQADLARVEATAYGEGSLAAGENVPGETVPERVGSEQRLFVAIHRPQGNDRTKDLRPRVCACDDCRSEEETARGWVPAVGLAAQVAQLGYDPVALATMTERADLRIRIRRRPDPRPLEFGEKRLE